MTFARFFVKKVKIYNIYYILESLMRKFILDFIPL